MHGHGDRSEQGNERKRIAQDRIEQPAREHGQQRETEGKRV